MFPGLFAVVRNIKRCRLSTKANTLLRHGRSFSEIIPEENEQVHKLLNSGKPQAVYAGFDPTAPSLHLGHLLCLINLIRFQRCGHQPIAVVGGATSLVGDPSGVEHPKGCDSRKPLSNEEIVDNSTKIQKMISQIFENHENYFWNEKDRLLAPVRVLNNLQWYGRMNFVHFLARYGRLFRVGDMMSRKCVKQRMESAVGISYAEFSYQVMQAYDWIHLLKKFDCKFQIGGNDQQGNIKTGIEAIKRHMNSPVYGMCVPLLTDRSGAKMAKSAGTPVWLDRNLCTPFELYQYLRKTPDAAVESYLQMLTFLSEPEIKSIVKEHQAHPEKCKAQIELAKSVVALVHGKEKLDEALICSEAVFARSFESLGQLDRKMASIVFKGLVQVELELKNDLTIKELLLSSNCFLNEELAIKAINRNSVYLNHVRVSNPDTVLQLGEHIMPGMFTLLSVGKQVHKLVIWRRFQEEEEED